MGPANKTVVGLDIEPGYVAAVQTTGGRVAVERAAYAPLPPGVVRDGEVADVETLANVLRDMFAEHKLGKRVRLGVANQRIVMRTIDLPPLTDEKQISSAVQFQAQEHIPMPLEQAVLEHHTLGPVETSDGPRTRVVLVAARRDMIDRLLEAITRAGLRPQAIDLSAFAMIRALHRPEVAGTSVYVNVGGITNLAIAEATTCVFTRVIPYGIESVAGELAERRGLTLEHSHGWLKHVGMVSPVEDVEGDSEIVVEARSVLTEGVRRIGDEVRNSLDFHVMQEGSSAIERVVLTGPAIAIPGFAEHIGQQIGLTVEVGLVSEAKAGGFGGIDAGRLAVAAGLTVEEISA
ncbi:MAG TPA: type IV pilus assembly protein PilM [Solirubrobacteraceae bacterium]|nr:type IV pilus assembly protein PilM [Solirubrobacteraceae bacterium]